MDNFFKMSNLGNLHNDVDIIKLRPNIRNKLAGILDDSIRSWKDLAEIIPANDNSEEPLYSAEEIWKFQSKGERNGGSSTLLLLDDWSRRGRLRPKASLLYKLLIETKKLRAADVIRTVVFKEPPLPVDTAMQTAVHQSIALTSSSVVSMHSMSDLPTLPIRSSCFETDNLSTEILSCATSVESLTSELPSFSITIPDSSTSVVKCSYATLAKITDQFNSKPLCDNGRHIGEGAFGSVFLGIFVDNIKVAVKKLKVDPEVVKQFKTEIDVLSQFKHKNLLELLGYCDDHIGCCLIYNFMPGHSLEYRLACKSDHLPLNWSERVSIASGTARGILHLHTFLDKPLVHRDIKSANILLDDELNAKVGDFGLVRQGSRGSGAATTAVKTDTVFGTSVYMPREAFQGDISIKLDVFSFGIVLLELLSGMPPFNAEKQEDLLSHILDEYEDVAEFLDAKAGQVDMQQANAIYAISQKCTYDAKTRRPSMHSVVEDLENIVPKG